MIHVPAIYENGLLRLTQPVHLTEGQRVTVSIVPERSADEWARRLRAAGSIEEWVALADSCPDPDPEFDVSAAINESRRLTGFRMPDPQPEAERPA